MGSDCLARGNVTCPLIRLYRVTSLPVHLAYSLPARFHGLGTSFRRFRQPIGSPAVTELILYSFDYSEGRVRSTMLRKQSFTEHSRANLQQLCNGLGRTAKLKFVSY
jgi:hypothetical protein